MTLNEIKQLAVYAAKKEAPVNFTAETVDKALADGFKSLAGSINAFNKNKYDIFDIMIEAIDEVVPKSTIDAVGMFAEVKVVGQGQKTLYKQKFNKNRAKKFLTQVGLSGVYETFRLDSQTFELPVHAIGGAVDIDFERMLDGEETMSEVMEILTQGLSDSVFVEIQKALVASVGSTERPTANYHTGNSFDAAEMLKIVRTVKNWGTGAVIMAAPEFVDSMGADAIVPGSATVAGVYHPEDIDNIYRTGYIKNFRGTPVIQIPQSFIDETNTKTWINPQLAYILPTGGNNDKVVKVTLEGQTQMNSFTNRDNSMEIHAYRKIGVGILTMYNWGIYKNTGITDTSAEVYGI